MVRPSPTASATSFAVGTKRKGNDGNTYAVIATKTGVQRWVKKTKATTATHPTSRGQGTKATTGTTVVSFELKMQVRHPLFAKCNASNWDTSVCATARDPDSYPKMDKEARQLLMKGLLHPEFTDYVRESVQYAFEGMLMQRKNIFTIPAYTVKIVVPSARGYPGLRAAVTVTSHGGKLLGFTQAHFLKELDEVLDHGNRGGGGYQGPRAPTGPPPAKNAAPPTLWSLGYVVDASAPGAYVLVPRGATVTKGSRKVVRAHNKRGFQGLFGMTEDVTHVQKYEMWRDKEVYNDDMTVACNVKK